MKFERRTFPKTYLDWLFLTAMGTLAMSVTNLLATTHLHVGCYATCTLPSRTWWITGYTKRDVAQHQSTPTSPPPAMIFTQIRNTHTKTRVGVHGMCAKWCGTITQVRNVGHTSDRLSTQWMVQLPLHMYQSGCRHT